MCAVGSAQKEKNMHSRQLRGFTLVELAVVLIIVALMVGFGLQALHGSNQNNCYEKTRVQMRDIQGALEKFVLNGTNNRYPDAADPAVGSANGLFGREGGAATVGNMHIGAVPTGALGLPNSYATDCWGTKFTYAVTTALTSNSPTTGYPSAANGTLTVHKDGGSLMSNAAYVLVSHGEDKMGGTPLTTADRSTNSCSVSATKPDTNNCDRNDTNFYDVTFNNGSNAANFFDDLVAYGEKFPVVPANADCTAGAAVSWCDSASGSAPCYVSGCSATLGSNLPHGNSTSMNYSNGGTSGSATVSCNNGTLSATSATCGMACTGVSVNWFRVSPNACTGNPGGMAAGQSVPLQDSTGTTQGSTTAICNGATGAISTSGGTCVEACTASGARSWLTNCGRNVAPPVLVMGGTSEPITNTNPGYSGSVNLYCNPSTGSLHQQSETCTAVSVNCTPQSVTWGTGCSASVGSTVNDGNSTPVTNSAVGFIGSGTASCTNGTLTATGTCTAHCPAQTVTWETNCSVAMPATNHNEASAAVQNTASGFVGQADIRCFNGAYATTNVTCYDESRCRTGNMISETVNEDYQTPQCESETYRTMCCPEGETISCSHINIECDQQGAQTGCQFGTCTTGISCTCSGGGGGGPAACTAGSTNWGAGCSASYGSLISGNYADRNNEAANFTGSIRVSCNNGVISTSGGSCNSTGMGQNGQCGSNPYGSAACAVGEVINYRQVGANCDCYGGCSYVEYYTYNCSGVNGGADSGNCPVVANGGDVGGCS